MGGGGGGAEHTLKLYLRKKETQQVEIYFSWLNDGLMKSLLEMSN